MTLTHNIYEGLLLSTERNKEQISQRFDLPNQRYLIFATSKKQIRHLYFLLNDNDVEFIPKCNGIDISAVYLPEYEVNAVFCDLAQAYGSESYIYETIIEDIRLTLENKINADIFTKIVELLTKWKNFFAKNMEILLSSERQQGLYGELRFLEELIYARGTKAVMHWTGCSYETHDFYFDGNACEIKTTITKAPYKMHISSEYQLDDKEIEKSLYVRFYAFRKSDADGDKLCNIINRIRELLKDNPHAKMKFEECLEEYGYFDSVSDYYVSGYSDREKLAFVVNEFFPRLTPGMLSDGLVECKYSVLVDQCSDSLIDENCLKGILEGEYNNGR